MNYLSLHDAVFDISQTCGSNFVFLACKPKPVYRNGIRTNETNGFQAEIFLADRGKTMNVTLSELPNAKPMTQVKIKNLILRAYSMNGKAGITAKADSIEAV